MRVEKKNKDKISSHSVRVTKVYAKRTISKMAPWSPLSLLCLLCSPFLSLKLVIRDIDCPYCKPVPSLQVARWFPYMRIELPLTIIVQVC